MTLIPNLAEAKRNSDSKKRQPPPNQYPVTLASLTLPMANEIPERKQQKPIFAPSIHHNMTLAPFPTMKERCFLIFPDSSPKAKIVRILNLSESPTLFFLPILTLHHSLQQHPLQCTSPQRFSQQSFIKQCQMPKPQIFALLGFRHYVPSHQMKF